MDGRYLLKEMLLVWWGFVCLFVCLDKIHAMAIRAEKEIKGNQFIFLPIGQKGSLLFTFSPTFVVCLMIAGMG